jgi:lipid-A-disaccharide synthase
MSIRIGLIVGEVSGENLALGLIKSLRQYYPELTFEGVLGPKLIAEGGSSLYPMDRLSMIGFFEPLKRLPQLLLMRRRLIQHFIANPPDIFIGVDAPDFNLSIERALKKHGIKVVHYVSPSVWAWRQNRIHSIKKSIDLMMALLPFEVKFYQQHQTPVCFTGHPLADEIPLLTPAQVEIETRNAKAQLNWVSEKSEQAPPVIALLPGSRNGELKYLAEIFLQTAQYCYAINPHLKFVAPLVSESHKQWFMELQQKVAPHLPIQIMIGNTRLAIAAADVVLVASGTATLEVMLHKKPMVVAYRMSAVSIAILSRLLKVPYIALPNLLAENFVVPEHIQSKATPELLCPALLKFLSPDFDRVGLINQFNELHKTIKRNASETAAKAVHTLMS